MEKKFIGGLVTGGLVGTVFGMGLTTGILNIKSPTERARFIEKENTPRVMKVYNGYEDGANFADQILIEDPDNSGRYIRLSKYLKRDFKNKYERNLERARIKLLVSQREGK